MGFLETKAPVAQDPIRALAEARGDMVMAVITGVDGPSYRPLGAVMAIRPDGGRVGTLSSGCVEGDIVTNAMTALGEGRVISLRYGRGSPFLDIELPCGGGLEIRLIPRPDREVLRRLAMERAARRPAVLSIDATGTLSLGETGQTGWDGADFRLRFEPALRFLVFGKGPEALTFAGLVRGAGYPHLLLSPDDETLDLARSGGTDTRALNLKTLPEGLGVDPWTAAVLFFHDHDWEPPLLSALLDTPAFYVGAQGSRRAAAARDAALRELGVPDDRLARLTQPVGLIPSARDAGTLAVSVLAEILARAMAPQRIVEAA